MANPSLTSAQPPNPRFYTPLALGAGQTLDLPPGAARHVQVLRMQPGQEVTLFNGLGGQWRARIEQMARLGVRAHVLEHVAVEREARCRVHLRVSLMAPQRLEWLIEKAVELGAASLTPIIAARSQFVAQGQRAEKKLAHWHAVVAAAAEQCGRNALMAVHAPVPFEFGLESECPLEEVNKEVNKEGIQERNDPLGPLPSPQDLEGGRGRAKWILTPNSQGVPLKRAQNGLDPEQAVWLLSGPEGGFTEQEMGTALRRGWQAVWLGERVLRAETAPLAALAQLTGV